VRASLVRYSIHTELSLIIMNKHPIPLCHRRHQKFTINKY